jgi:hypothetical protein
MLDSEYLNRLAKSARGRKTQEWVEDWEEANRRCDIRAKEEATKGVVGASVGLIVHVLNTYISPQDPAWQDCFNECVRVLLESLEEYDKEQAQFTTFVYERLRLVPRSLIRERARVMGHKTPDMDELSKLALGTFNHYDEMPAPPNEPAEVDPFIEALTDALNTALNDKEDLVELKKLIEGKEDARIKDQWLKRKAVHPAWFRLTEEYVRKRYMSSPRSRLARLR